MAFWSDLTANRCRVEKTGAELDKLAPLFAGTTVRSEVALLHSYESRWAIEWQPQTYKFDPLQELARYYAPLHRAMQAVDIVSPDVDLSRYKLVVAPALNLVTAKEADNLLAYVKAGGNLVLGPRSLMKDGDNSLQPNRQPGPLESLLGGRVEQFYALASSVAGGCRKISSGVSHLLAHVSEARHGAPASRATSNKLITLTGLQEIDQFFCTNS